MNIYGDIYGITGYGDIYMALWDLVFNISESISDARIYKQSREVSGIQKTKQKPHQETLHGMVENNRWFSAYFQYFPNKMFLGTDVSISPEIFDMC